LLTIDFCYLFSTPRGYVQTRKLLHTSQSTLMYRAGFDPATFRSWIEIDDLVDPRRMAILAE
jgi:hypothetical protein